MVESENHTLGLLQEIDRSLRELCGQIEEFRNKMERDLQKICDKIDSNYCEHEKCLDSLELAMQRKTFANQCAIARSDKRISALEKRAASRPRKPK